MKKFEKLFVYAALLLVLGIAGCTFDIPVNAEKPVDTETADDPTTAPPPEGQVWVKISLPQDGDRALAGDSKNSLFIDSYEVYFHQKSPQYLFFGSAKRGEVLAAAVVPNVTYEVLLLAGDSATRTLIASAYTEAKIVSGQVNQVNLSLVYVESDVFDSTNKDFKVIYTDAAWADASSFDAIAAADGYEVDTVTIVTGGEGYTKGDVVSISSTTNVTSDQDINIVYIEVTEAGETDGDITAIKVLQGGRWAANVSASSLEAVSVKSNATEEATFTLSVKKAVDIPGDIPWITYVPYKASTSNGTTRENPLVFDITTRGLGPLIKTEGASATTLPLANATIKLSPLYKNGYAKFIEATGTGGLSPALVTVSSENVGITVRYSILAADLPLFSVSDSYGILYYTADYSPFGKGKTWSIRNGIDINRLDNSGQAAGFAGGTGILVKIGNPGVFVDGPVDVEAGAN
jgi:hypothetical protein